MLRWLLTYSDMITLLMVFFIVLYAVSQVDKARYEVLMKALKQVLSGQQVVTQTGGTIPIPPPVVGKVQAPPVQPAAAQNMQALAQEIQQAVQVAGLQADVSVTNASIGIRVSFLNGILFDLGRATIRQQSYPLLNHIAAVLQTVPNTLVIEGYTDDQPIDTYLFHSNWDLSAIRATRVIEYMIGRGLDPGRFSAQAFSQYHPIATNATPQGRQQNRRVDLVILKGVPYTTEQVTQRLDGPKVQ